MYSLGIEIFKVKLKYKNLYYKSTTWSLKEKRLKFDERSI